jgi:hypothetical protein
MEGFRSRSGSVERMSDRDPGGPKTFGSSGSGSTILSVTNAWRKKPLCEWRGFLITVSLSVCSGKGRVRLQVQPGLQDCQHGAPGGFYRGETPGLPRALSGTRSYSVFPDSVTTWGSLSLKNAGHFDIM